VIYSQDLKVNNGLLRAPTATTEPAIFMGNLSKVSDKTCTICLLNFAPFNTDRSCMRDNFITVFK